MNFSQIIQSFIEESRLLLKSGHVKADDYKEFLKNISEEKCPVCMEKLEIVSADEKGNVAKYKFKCGHSHIHAKFHETIVMREHLKLKLKKPGKGLLLQECQGYKSSGDPKLPNGVTEKMIIDKEKKEYHHVVIDNSTGNIIHEEHEPLTQHKPKKK
ncbi:MAG: hypothetical protein NT145_05185 [Elusimicrobia bacterium]|nr:hypothetical protein [Elusimicrobiota bacterium]